MKTIYLDYAAATPTREEALFAMQPYLAHLYGNPSSIHHKGREAFDAIEHARTDIASLLSVSPSEILFTGSGTEANNLALFGVLRTREKGHLLVSQIEHPSVLTAASRLYEEGYEVEYIPVGERGVIDVDDVLRRIREDTTLVSIMYANNEIGSVEPIQELSEALKKRAKRPLLHTDACQATGQLPINPNVLGVDLMTLNSSKAYGPKGVGLLYVRRGISLVPCSVGGSQEHGLRAGTENVAAIVGFSAALRYALEHEREFRERLLLLRERMFKRIEEKLPQAIINGDREARLPNNVHLSLPHVEGESLLLILDTYGICASTGSACNSHALLPSHVLRAIGQSDELMHGSIRFTLGKDTTESDIDAAVDALAIATEALLKISPLPLSLP